MTFPRIVTKATNVELTSSLEDLITRRLAPLARLLRFEEPIRFDVVIRRNENNVAGDMYFVSVKVSSPKRSYMAVAAKPHLPRALSSVRETLRQNISRGASVDMSHFAKSDTALVKNAYTLTLS